MSREKITYEDIFRAGKNILRFFNLLDSEGHLSITNVAVAIVLFKLYNSPSASITEAGMLLITLANYAHKRAVNQASQTPEDDTTTTRVNQLQTKIDEMSTQVSAMSIQSGIKKLGGN